MKFSLQDDLLAASTNSLPFCAAAFPAVAAFSANESYKNSTSIFFLTRLNLP